MAQAQLLLLAQIGYFGQVGGVLYRPQGIGLALSAGCQLLL